MHNLSGSSQFFDRIRRVLLAASIELQMTEAEARILISNVRGGPAEAIVFDHPKVLAALDQLANAIEELGGSIQTGRPVGQRAKWMICANCQGAGWFRNNHDDWHECPVCEGAGTIIVRE
jgi:hypothetical protein